MKAERWKQIKTLYQRAIDTAPESRNKFLSENCGNDAELLHEVESMLKFETESGDALEEPLFEVAVKLLTENETLPIGERIDNYRTVREIGRGGMGIVYEAERVDGLFEQRVALKIIKRGMDTDAILKRFVMERQILASLDHPNIARLLDGGTTTDGLPYFVLEYVEGLPVDKFCVAKNLNLTEKLKLFRQVCEAVTYAHQHLVVHRDLKPSNILVNENGVPKLLDFGIAKLLHTEAGEETRATETVARMMTPEYASPEQIKGEKITTLSDVYSLGVLLSKLVGGSQWAVVSKNNEEPQGKQIQNPKSKIQNRSDLDVILQTALHEETDRRYSSAEAFSDDIRRFLEGLPVLAQKDSTLYRVSKFVQRHKAAVALSSLAIVMLIFAAVFSVWQARKANLAQLRAEQRFNDVRKLANNVLFSYHDKIENLPDSTEVRDEMLKDSLIYLDSLSQEVTDDRELLRELGSAYEKVGTIQGNTWSGNLNDTPAMLVSYQKSFDIRQKLARLEPDNDEIQRELAIAYENVGDSHHQIGELQKCLENYQKAWEIINKLAAKDSKHLTYLARLHGRIAHVQGFPGEINLGNSAESTANYLKASEIMQKLYDSEPKNTRYRWGITVHLRNYANMLLHTGKAQEALKELNKAVPIAEDWAKDEPDNIEAIEAVSIGYSKTSDVFSELGDLTKALEFQKKAIAVDEPAYLSDPKNGRSRDIYAWYDKLAMLYKKQKNYAEAEKLSLKALKIIEESVADNPSNLEQKTSLADIQYDYAEILIEKGDISKANEYLEKALKIYEESAVKDEKNFRAQINTAQVFVSFGDIYAKKREFAEALKYYEKALPIFEAQTQRDSVNALLQRALQQLQTKISNVKNK